MSDLTSKPMTPERLEKLADFLDQLGNKPWIAEIATYLRDQSWIVANPPEATGAPANALELARLFHETYERLAPQFGYETRQDTREFSPSSTNGQLMRAVCESLLLAMRPNEPLRLPFGMSVPAPGTKCDHGVLLEDECEACNSSTKADRP